MAVKPGALKLGQLKPAPHKLRKFNPPKPQALKSKRGEGANPRLAKPKVFNLKAPKPGAARPEISMLRAAKSKAPKPLTPLKALNLKAPPGRRGAKSKPPKALSLKLLNLKALRWPGRRVPPEFRGGSCPGRPGPRLPSRLP